MQLTVTGKHLALGRSLRGHVERSVSATIGKYFGNAIEASVVLKRDGQRIRSEISVHIGRGINIHGHAEAMDATESFDLAVAHVGKQLRRTKRRLRDHHNTKGVA